MKKEPELPELARDMEIIKSLSRVTGLTDDLATEVRGADSPETTDGAS